MLARDLPGGAGATAQAFHRHEESFIGREPGARQAGDFPAKLLFPACDLVRPAGGLAAEMAAPLFNLFFEPTGVICICHGSASATDVNER
jgi:hypothetical protein